MAVDVKWQRLGGLRRRSVWTLATASLDSLGTLVFSVWMAREVTAVEFGSYALGLTIHQIAIGLSTGAGSLTMLVRLGTSEGRFSRVVAGDVTGVTAAAAVLPITAFLGLAAVGGDPLTTTSLAFAAITPGLLLQACCIHLFYARQQQAKALLNNAIWLAVQVPLLLVVPPALAPHEAWSYLLCWGVAAYAAVAVSLVQMGTVPRLDRVPAWIREHRATMGDLMLENTAGRVGMQSGAWVLGAVAGLRVLGGFRASQVVFGPTRVFNVGLSPMVLAEGVRLYERAPVRLRRLVRGWMALNASLCVVIGAVLLAMPDAAGRAIAGDTWRYAEPILVWAVAISISNAVLVPAQTGLRCLGSTRLAAVVRTVTMPLPALFTLAGGLLGDGYTAMMGLAIGSILATLTATTAFERRFHKATSLPRQ
jgi:O-antigen/teichoic acid export membrane protein